MTRFGSNRRTRGRGVGILNHIGNDVSGVDARDVDGALRASGLDWRVERRPVYHESPSGILTRDERSVALVRSDTGEVFGYASPRYVPAQNREIMSLFSEVLGGLGLAWDRAGANRDGSLVFCLATIATIAINGEEHTLHLLMQNGHDTTAAFRVGVAWTRIVCANQLPGLERANNAVRLRHNSVAIRDLSGIVSGIARTIEAGRTQAATFERLSITRGDVAPIIDAVYPLGGATDGALRARETVRGLYEGQGIALGRGSLWDAVHAVTEYEDHHAPRRSDESGIWGAGAQRKALALETAVALLDGSPAPRVIEGTVD